MKVAGKEVQGIGCHANSLISYQLPANHKFTRFLATGTLDDGGTGQGYLWKPVQRTILRLLKKPKVLGGRQDIFRF